MDVSDIFAKSDFRVFQSALETGGVIRVIRRAKRRDMSRKEVDE